MKKLNLLLMLLALNFVSCNKDEETIVKTSKPADNCDTATGDFKTIFGLPGSVTYDFDVHSYDFVLSTNKTICKFGYQSQTANVANPYTIKILQGTTVIYSGLHLFNNTAVSYVSPTSAIALTAGVTYTIERVQTQSMPGNSQNIGMVKAMTGFPVSAGIMTITGSDFYFVSSNGTVLQNTTGVNLQNRIPFIDIIFQ